MLSWGPEAGSFPVLAGDFYRDQEDSVTRGVTLCSGDEFLDFTDYTGQVKHDCTSRLLEEEAGWQNMWNYDAKPIPEDNFFRLGQTTILVDSTSAEEVQNRLLCLLADDDLAELLKVNRMKFTIKAKIHLDGLSCVTKVYIYKKGAGQYVIDIQRRSGDHLVFQRLYRWVSQHLAGDQVHGVEIPSVFRQAPVVADADCLQGSLRAPSPMLTPLGQVCH